MFVCVNSIWLFVWLRPHNNQEYSVFKRSFHLTIFLHVWLVCLKFLLCKLLLYVVMLYIYISSYTQCQFVRLIICLYFYIPIVSLFACLIIFLPHLSLPASCFNRKVKKWKERKREKQSSFRKYYRYWTKKNKNLHLKIQLNSHFFKLKDCFCYDFMLIFLTYFWHFYWPIFMPIIIAVLGLNNLRIT